MKLANSKLSLLREKSCQIRRPIYLIVDYSIDLIQFYEAQILPSKRPRLL
jgi:hypothetical protein